MLGNATSEKGEIQVIWRRCKIRCENPLWKDVIKIRCPNPLSKSVVQIRGGNQLTKSVVLVPLGDFLGNNLTRYVAA